MCALLLGLALTPFAPDTGSVSANPQIPHRVDAAHQIVSAAVTAGHVVEIAR
ncbi:hypothetical protein [Terrihabitans sp. B22-R8]|uniref:hypothetical protein n=1 Tax=Terrihabitans sp. B22-R8 TaxID=3425128 RepID=UPI00403C593D